MPHNPVLWRAWPSAMEVIDTRTVMSCLNVQSIPAQTAHNTDTRGTNLKANTGFHIFIGLENNFHTMSFHKAVEIATFRMLFSFLDIHEYLAD